MFEFLIKFSTVWIPFTGLDFVTEITTNRSRSGVGTGVRHFFMELEWICSQDFARNWRM